MEKEQLANLVHRDLLRKQTKIIQPQFLKSRKTGILAQHMNSDKHHRVLVPLSLYKDQ